MKKVLVIALAIGLVTPVASHAATSTTKPKLTKSSAAPASEGTASHEMSESTNGTEEGNSLNKKAKKLSVKKTSHKKVATKKK